jgi:L-seryl-tRNA(Ser) seleniumtransferase
METSGARLREVGTTNRTHEEDYRRAIGPATAVLLKVHRSNFEIRGFTATVPLAALVALGREHGFPVVEDLGSGALADMTPFGLSDEPVVRERIAMGADIVTFSGDKLLGGPQAGLIVGRRDLVARLAAHPLARALRPSKLTLAALEATLMLHRDAPSPGAVIPTLRYLGRPLAEIAALAEDACGILRRRLGPDYRVSVAESVAEVGSGAAPGSALPSHAVVITHPVLDAETIAARFRRATPPVLGRIRDGCFLLDLRAIDHAVDLDVVLE